MKKKYIKTGEFAALCHVTKDTLFHYDALGILKPARVNEKGYRLYAVNQIYTFDLISVLKEVGMSLQEIKTYMEHRNTTAFLHMLQEKDAIIKNEINRLQRLRRLVKNTISITHESFHVRMNGLEFLELPEMYFAVTPGEQAQDEKSLAEAISQHIIFCMTYHIDESLTMGEIIGEEGIINKTYYPQYYCSQIARTTRRSKYIHRKPAGLYAVRYIQGSYEGLAHAYAQFDSDVQDAGYQLCRIYEEDMINYLSEVDYENYVMKLEGLIMQDKTNRPASDDSAPAAV